MSANTITRTVAPECYVIKVGRGYFAHRDWDADSARDHWVGTLDVDMAATYRTADEANAVMLEQQRDGYDAKVLRRKAQTVTELTDAGREAVKARRAARRAERGW